MFFQNTGSAPLDFRHYACNFADALRARPVLGGADFSLDEAVAAWKHCRLLGIISGDLNSDGDFDDPGEDEITDYDRLFTELKIPLRTVDIHSLGLPVGPDRYGVERLLPVASPLDPARYWVHEAWFWQITHFVVGDGTGRKPVKYDSIRGGSLTVLNGKIETIRVFEITAQEAGHDHS